MKNILSAIGIAGTLLLGGQASASELWAPQLPGADIGLAGGAAPPPGVYAIWMNYWAEYKGYGQAGGPTGGSHSNAGANLSALVEVPILLWVPGVKILGGDFWTAIAQPFDYTSYGPTNSASTGSGNWGTYNTILFPAFVSWTFGDLHVATGLRVHVANASTTMSQVANGEWIGRKSGLPSGNGYWTIQPDVAISWLHDGWNLSAWWHFPVPVSSTTATDYNYRSGAQLEADYTVAKTFGKWTVGIGAYQLNQFNSDTCSGVACPNYFGTHPSTNNHKIATRFGMGPIVGYQFGGINVDLTVAQSIYTRNDVGGLFANLRFIVPF